MIRRALTNDIEEINKLGIIFNNNFLNTYNIDLYLDNENYIVLVHEEENINAFLIVYKNIDYFELEAIVVDPQYRNRRIAYSLLEFFMYNYTQKNDVILLEVAENNIPALNLYKKCNFEIISTRKKYYNNIDAYVMKKVI